MYLIVGLGNPEPEYSKTRHNMGFDVINKVSKKYNIDLNKNGFKSIYGMGIIEGQKVILCKPQTFMNLSGEALVEIMNFYKIKKEKLIVIYDDIDIEPGTVRIRRKGSAGTHNGMRSVVELIGTSDFIRIRVGTGKPEFEHDLINHVIKKLTDDQYGKLEEGINIAEEALLEIIKNGIDIAMNKIN